MGLSVTDTDLFWREIPARAEVLKQFAESVYADLESWRTRAARAGLTALASIAPARQAKDGEERVFVQFLTTGRLPASKCDMLTGLAIHLFQRAAAAGPVNDIYLATIGQRPDIRRDLSDYCDLHEIDLGRLDWRKLSVESKVKETQAQTGISNLFAFFDGLIAATTLPALQESVVDTVFPKRLAGSDVDFRRFLIYRNSIESSRFSKMYAFLRRPYEGYPYPSFSLWYCDDNGLTLQTTSIIIGAKQTIYLLGPLGDGTGLSIVAVKRADLRQAWFSGLQLTTDSAGDPMASRLLFVPTLCEHHRDAKIGIYDRDDIGDEGLTPEQLEQLRNRVGIERDDLVHDGSPLPHAAMADMVAARLASSPILIQDGGAIYNPASAEHVPFNTALHLRS